MTYEEAIYRIEDHKNIHFKAEPAAVYITEALDVAIEALRKQIEIENSQFTHICKSENDYYPTTFTIYARVVEEDNNSVTLDRFQKFGALPLKQIIISREDFERYYRPITD